MAIILTTNKLAKNLPWTINRSAQKLFLRPLIAWLFLKRRPHNIVFQPYDFNLLYPAYAKEFYHGKFPLAGRVIQTGSDSAFNIQPPTPAWEEELHSFGWLRHLHAANNELSSAIARTQISEWFKVNPPKLASISWRTDIVADRLTSWLSHSSMLMHNASNNFKIKLLRSITFQFYYLQNILPTSEDNHIKLKGYIALTFAALALDINNDKQKQIIKKLEKNLTKQILPDGNHISRSPLILLQLLTDLLALKHSFKAKLQMPTIILIETIERMLPALKFFIHQDGSLARFNGVGGIMKEQITNILELDESGGKPLSTAPHGGYKRFLFGDSTIIADIGKIPPKTASNNASGGCLSFELSSNNYCFIVNSGINYLGPQEHIFLGRLSAAHSTAIVNDSSSCIFKHKSDSTAIIDGPQNVHISNIDNQNHYGFIGIHDGYLSRFGLLHKRALLLHKNNRLIEGFDEFIYSNNKKTKNLENITIRFHLHPNIEINFDKNADLKLEAPNNTSWLFSSPDIAANIEDSIYFATLEGTKKTKQIVLNVNPKQLTKLRWRFIRIF